MVTMKSFKSLLLAVSEDLTSSDLDKLKFLYSTDIPAGPLEKVTQGFQLFTFLRQNNLLSEENREPLSKKLIDVGRKDLSNKLLGIQGTPGPVEERRQQFPTLDELRPALPAVQPPTPMTTVIPPGQQAPLAATNGSYSSTSSTRVPCPAEPDDTFSRQPPPGQASATGTSSTGLDMTDHGPERVIRTSVQVDSSLRQKLSSDGCFLDPEKYDPVKILGAGGFAKVFLVIQKSTGKEMACKMIDLGENHRETQEHAKKVSDEVKAHSVVKHKYIVEFFYVEEVRNTLLLFLECMEGGSVEDLLKHEGSLQELRVRKFTWQLLTAVDFLHNSWGIIHKDIKGGNILLDRPQTNLKLADFGICTIMEELKTATGGLVTKNNIASFHWTSPELLAGEEFGRNTDIWSVGCTVIEMLTTKPPLFFDNLSMRQKQYRITNHQVEPPTNCTSLAFGFLKRCLCPKEERASAAELLTDPFVSEIHQ